MEIISSKIQQLEGLSQDEAVIACNEYCGKIQAGFCIEHNMFPCHAAVELFRKKMIEKAEKAQANEITVQRAHENREK